MRFRLPIVLFALTLFGCSSPPPTITSVTPSTVANTQDTTITIVGTHFQKTPKVTIAIMGQTPITLAVTYVDAQTVTAVVPMGTPAGSYVLTLTNPDGKSATAMLTVTTPPPITIKTVTSPYACSTQDTPITIDGDNFESTPQALLVAAGAAGANLPLKNVAFLSATKLTAVVPAGGVVGGPYALKITNPDGATGQLAMAFTITQLCPPVVDDVTPSEVVHNYNTMATGSTPITVTGKNFHMDASVVLVDQNEQEVMLPNVKIDASGAPTKLVVNFDASSMNLTDGIYLVRVKESDAPTSAGGTGVTMTGDYSLFVVANPSGKFASAVAGTALPSGRRGLGVIGGQLNAASRFLSAIAGDSGGMAPTLLADGLVAPLSLFGNIADAGWLPLRKRAANPASGDTSNDLSSARTGIGIATWNGWVYVIGGTTALGAAGLGAPFSPMTPTAEVWKARILPADEAPTVSAVAATTVGKLMPGTYYYKVAALVAAGTSGYGPNAAETVASDEQVVTLTGTSTAVTLTISPAAALAGHVTGYRVYRTAMADGVSQTEVFLADAAASGSYTDDGSATTGMAHPLTAGLLSEWEPGPSLLVPRAFPAVSIATTRPTPTTTAPYLYVVGGASSATAAEKTYEVSPLSSGAAAAFGPTGLAPGNANNCTTVETCMASARWSPFAVSISDPPSVTNPATSWLLAGAGATAAAQQIDEHAEITAATGVLGAWSAVQADNAFAFTISADTLAPIGFYENGYLAIVDGYRGGVQNKDEFTSLICAGTSTMGVCDAGQDFKQGANAVLNARSNSNLALMPPVAWAGYTITSGYIFVVGGTTDGMNAVTTVLQGAQ